MLKAGDLNRLYIQTNHMHFRRTHNRLIGYGLGEGQPRFLWHLSQTDGISQAELARHSKMEPATVTVTLTRMERSGLVERRPDSHDLRITRVWLTEAGRKMHKEIEQLYMEIEEECFAGFSDSEKEQFQQFLIRMRDNLRHAEEHSAISKEGTDK